jgi:hypothetical protein
MARAVAAFEPLKLHPKVTVMPHVAPRPVASDLVVVPIEPGGASRWSGETGVARAGRRMPYLLDRRRRASWRRPEPWRSS